MKVLTQDIQKWIGEVWFPKAVSTGLKHFAFVVPKDVLASMSMKAVNSKNNSIEIKYFDNEPSAKTWLNSK